MTEETSNVEVAQPRPPILITEEDFIIKNEHSDKVEPTEEKQEPTEETQEEPDEVEQLKIKNKKIINANSRKEKIITKLGGKLDEANRTIAELQQKLAAPAPREEDFEGQPYGDYLKAVTRHELKVGNAEEAIANLTNEATQLETELGESSRAALDESGEIAEKTYPDFRQVIESLAAQSSNGKLEFSQPAWDAIQRSDDGASAIYAMAKENKLGLLNSLPPIEAAMMVKEYEIRAKSLPKIKHVSTAPEPITSARGIASTSKDPSQMNDAEFNEWRRNSIASKNRR